MITTKKEFEIYAMMYIASLDQKISQEEVEMMMMKISSKDDYEKIRGIFEKDNDMATIETLRDGKKKFLKTDDQVKEFIQELTALANADEKSSPIEIANINMLERMLMKD